MTSSCDRTFTNNFKERTNQSTLKSIISNCYIMTTARVVAASALLLLTCTLSAHAFNTPSSKAFSRVRKRFSNPSDSDSQALRDSQAWQAAEKRHASRARILDLPQRLPWSEMGAAVQTSPIVEVDATPVAPPKPFVTMAARPTRVSWRRVESTAPSSPPSCWRTFRE